jgi:hypothetical protein
MKVLLRVHKKSAAGNESEPAECSPHPSQLQVAAQFKIVVKYIGLDLHLEVPLSSPGRDTGYPD